MKTSINQVKTTVTGTRSGRRKKIRDGGKDQGDISWK
jgi:hypothetical protein